MSRTVIVGGVAAGASCAARLRRLKEEEEIILLERGEYISYANCGLPYHVGDVIKEREALLVTKKEMMQRRFRIDVRNNSEVVSIDREEKKVHVVEKSGEAYDLSYNHLVLATGSSPLKPRIPGMDSHRVKTLWTVPDTDEIKREINENRVERVAVVGGGFIGLEMAENLHALGMEVSIIEASNQVMAPIDYEMSLILNEEMSANGVDLVLGDGVTSFDEIDGAIDVKLASGRVITADLVILAIGVRPNSQLALDAGLKCNERGGIIVDSHMRTDDPLIYAAGDVIEVEDLIFGDQTMVPLAGPANKQGRIVADNIAGREECYKGTQGSSIAKIFGLTVASTGVNEKTLGRKGLIKDKDYKVILISQNSHAGYYPGATPLFLKLIFSMDGNKIYGAQIVGKEGVDKRIDTLGTAIRLGASVYDLKDLEFAYAPPYSSAKDPVNMAGYVAENVLSGNVTFAEWDALDQESHATILDVREDQELKMFSFEDAIHIPLGQLRARLEELDRDTEYIIFCAIGVRAYNAYRILYQHGFRKIKIYPSGTRFYTVTHKDKNRKTQLKACKF